MFSANLAGDRQVQAGARHGWIRLVANAICPDDAHCGFARCSRPRWPHCARWTYPTDQERLSAAGGWYCPIELEQLSDEHIGV